MIKEILHQVEDKMGMNADDTKNSNQGLSRQLIYAYMHTSCDKLSPKIKNVCLSLKLIQNGCI